MSKKDKLNNKVAVSASAAMICSADAPDKNTKWRTPEQIAREIQIYFAVGGTPQQYDRDTEFVAAKIREAVNAERSANLAIIQKHWHHEFSLESWASSECQTLTAIANEIALQNK